MKKYVYVSELKHSLKSDSIFYKCLKKICFQLLSWVSFEICRLLIYCMVKSGKIAKSLNEAVKSEGNQNLLLHKKPNGNNGLRLLKSHT